MSNKQPKSAADIYYTIIDYGEFKDKLDFTKDYITRTFQTNTSDSLIITGKSGCGKTTLVDKAVRSFTRTSKDNGPEISVIKLNGYINTSDASTIQSIGSKLGLEHSRTIKEIIDEVQSDKWDKKIIIVLDEFDQFCRKQQSLLYNLFHLNQNANHVCLIGITTDLDCMESLEKRVRSRLNARNIELGYPYDGRSQYLEFASQLLGGFKLGPQLSDALLDLYENVDSSIRSLKRFLVDKAEWDEKHNLAFKELASPHTSSVERLNWLTKNQLEIIILSVSYCVQKQTTSFNCRQLIDFTEKHNIIGYDLTSDEAIKNIFYLNNISLISPLKPNNGLFELTPFTQLTLNITARDLSDAMSENPALRTTRTGLFWDKLKW